MEFHPPAAAQTLWVRLLPDGRVIPPAGGAYPAPATWQIRRCWPHGGRTRCLLRATISRHAYFADVPEDDLAAIEREDGLLVHLERFASRS